MGERENKPFQLGFNGLLKVDFLGSRVTSDSGLILVRELDERALGPAAGGDVQGSARKEVVFGAARTYENGGAKLDHRAANRSCFWAE